MKLKMCLIDDQATKEEFLSPFRLFCRPLCFLNSCFLLTYSGHGTKVKDTSNDEEDGYDEAFVLYDELLLIDDDFFPSLKINSNQEREYSS